MRAKAYLLPLAIYVGVPLLASPLGRESAYALMVVLAGVALHLNWSGYPFARGRFEAWTSVFLGCAVAVIWVLLEGHYPPLFLEDAGEYHGFMLAARLIGAILVAPLVEELFTRDFLARYLSAGDWLGAPLGRFTLLSFVATAAFFGFAHARWLPALLAGIMYNLLLMRTGSIRSTIVAHGISNLVLVLYAVRSGAWQFVP